MTHFSHISHTRASGFSDLTHGPGASVALALLSVPISHRQEGQATQLSGALFSIAEQATMVLQVGQTGTPLLSVPCHQGGENGCGDDGGDRAVCSVQACLQEGNKRPVAPTYTPRQVLGNSWSSSPDVF